MNLKYLWIKSFIILSILGEVFLNQSVYAYASYRLKIELSPAVCLIDPSLQNRRKCLEGYYFTILGLFPEKSQNCITPTSAKLPPLQTQVISRIMPNEYVRQQVWTQVGGCESGDASQYFRKIATFAQNLNIPNEIRSIQTYTISHQYLKSRFIQLNPTLPADGIQFVCKMHGHHSYLVGVQICYYENGQYKHCSQPTQKMVCPDQFMIQGY